MTSDDLTLTIALNRAELALRIEALDRPNIERLHLEGLADAVAAQLRIERQKEKAQLYPMRYAMGGERLLQLLRRPA